MNLIQLALRRPYTFIVMAMLIVLATPFALLKMPTDILPEINIPVISIVWNYTGMSAQEMGQRITASNERSLTTTVSDIEHVESQTLAGIAVIKVFFQPKADIQTALAQVTAIEQTQLRQLPPGITPPLIIKYSASSIPVVQLGLSSQTLPEQSIFDAAVNILRPQLINIPGVAIPFPYGGKNKLISVDLDTNALQARGLSPADVVNAINAQNLILPSGTAKFGPTEYTVRMNGSTDTIAALNDLPVRTVNGATTTIGDVSFVRDGFAPQTNIVRQDGQRGVLLSVLKNGGASTLDIMSNLRAQLPHAGEIMPKEITVKTLFDQSVFVKAAVAGVALEALIAAGLTAALVLLFLGNWRSTLVVAITIPLSILTSVIILQILGETLNLMTLGGLALSVGVLVDQAIVTIENIERHLHLGTELNEAIIVGAGEIGVPAFVSTICICIVFVPMFFLSGVARFLFVPMAEAVVFAMAASYILSRTLVPTMVMLLMKGPAARRDGCEAEPAAARLPRVRRALRAGAPRLHAGAVGAALAPAQLLDRLHGVLPAVVRPVLRAGPRLLPRRRRRPGAPAHAPAHRHAHRGDGARRRRGRGRDPRAGAGRPARDGAGQPRRAQLRHQPVVQQRRHDRHAGRRDPDRAEGRPRANGEVRDDPAQASCRGASPASSSSSSRPTSSRRS